MSVLVLALGVALAVRSATAALGLAKGLAARPSARSAHATCDCSGFCSGQCSLPMPATPPQAMTVYRLTPRNITDLANKDSGDAEGDVFFSLNEYDLPLRCINGSGTEARGCFLDVNDVYMAFEVEVDGRWGPYGHCNPPHENSLIGNFSCRGMGHGPPVRNPHL